jgi:hypothetical protein
MPDSLDEIATLVRGPRPVPPPRPIAFTEHALAGVLDVVVLLFATVVFAALAESLPWRNALRAALRDFGWVLVFALCTIGDVVFAASPGKWILGFVIGTARAARAPMWRLLLRWCVKYAPVLIAAAGVAVLESGSVIRTTFGISASPALWSIAQALGLIAGVWAWCIALGAFLALLPTRRTLHDWIAGTAVFQDGRLAGEPVPPVHGFEVAPVPLPATPEPAPSDSPS